MLADPVGSIIYWKPSANRSIWISQVWRFTCSADRSSWVSPVWKSSADKSCWVFESLRLSADRSHWISQVLNVVDRSIWISQVTEDDRWRILLGPSSYGSCMLRDPAGSLKLGESSAGRSCRISQVADAERG
jgi:hypothetical protein